MFELIIIIYVYIVLHTLYAISRKTDVHQSSQSQKLAVLIAVVFWPLTLISIFVSIIILLFLLGLRYIYLKFCKVNC